MTRHWSAIASSLVFGAVFATTAFAQTSPNYTGTELRPGWSREGIDPAAARGRYAVSPAPTQLAQASSSQGRSFLPNWFGLGGGNSQNKQQPRQSQPNSMRPSSNQQRAANGNPNSGNRPDEGVPADSTPPDPATMQDAPLPGLGGTPFPRKAAQSTPGATTNKSAASPGEPQSPAYSPSTSAPRSASRQPLTSPTTATSSSSKSTSMTRNSPGRRTTPHISPDELRRELSGAFPTAGPSNDATPRTAQADLRTEPKTEELSPSRQQESSGDESAAVVSDTPLTLPTTPSAETAQTPSIQPPAAENTKPAMPQVSTPSPAAADAFGAAQRSRSAYGANNAVRMPFSTPSAPVTAPSDAAAPAAAPQMVRGKEVFGDALQVASGGDPNVLSSTQTPMITADIRGPKQIQVGREALYRVRLQNQGDLPAENVVATIRIPAGAEVKNSTATQGSVQPSQDPQNSGLQWHVARLDRRADETLEIRLIPRESRPLELGVSWTAAPIASRALVEVQEAKLQLDIAGPNEVLFGKPQVFKITLTNPGTGPAENVKIELVPPGGGQEAATSHTLGDLAAGVSQTVEVELTARDAGKMFVKAVATAEGGLSSESSKDIFCRKPELEVDYRGPATKYAGTLATYFVRVRNPGTAPAEDVTVRASVPDGAEFVSASEGQSYDAQNREVVWHLGTLAPGDDNFLELKCTLTAPGTNRVKIAAASATGDLAASKVAETNVEAIADLKLDVTDPNGPVAVGTQAVYEIHIQNRGASAAKDVNVVALFSEGIEPEQAEGAMYTVADGRVTFRTIEDLPAGRDLVLRIRAHATQPGTHVFRAEVLCKELDIKLAAEETTRFYADDVRADSAQPQGKAASRSDAFQPAVK